MVAWFCQEVFFDQWFSTFTVDLCSFQIGTSQQLLKLLSIPEGFTFQSHLIMWFNSRAYTGSLTELIRVRSSLNRLLRHVLKLLLAHNVVKAVYLVWKVIKRLIRLQQLQRLGNLTLIAHKLNQIWLEYLNSLSVNGSHWGRSLNLIIGIFGLLLHLHPIAVKQEHPLIHMEIFDI